jgi:hypothetical protein
MKQSQRIFLQRTLKLEQQYQPKIIAIIKAFRAQFISDLQTHGSGNLKPSATNIRG